MVCNHGEGLELCSCLRCDLLHMPSTACSPLAYRHLSMKQPGPGGHGKFWGRHNKSHSSLSGELAYRSV